MMIDSKRYTSGRIALANLSASIDSLERCRAEGATFEDLISLSNLSLLRGDLLGRIADHDRAEAMATRAVAIDPENASALYGRGRFASRFHKFAEATTLLYEAEAAGHPAQEIDSERAALMQATGQYAEALTIRERLATHKAGIDTLGALASLLAEMGEWLAAEAHYMSALDNDDGISPFPCGQLLFEWAVNAMRRRDLDRAEQIFSELHAILPAHVPGRGHRAEVALARGEFDAALALVTPLLDIADDPEYRATYAEILAARGDAEAAAIAAQRAAIEYERLLTRRPEAYADHAAFFFIGIGNRPQRALELAEANWRMRDTPRSRKLLDKAREKAQQISALEEAVP